MKAEAHTSAWPYDITKFAEKPPQQAYERGGHTRHQNGAGGNVECLPVALLGGFIESAMQHLDGAVEQLGRENQANAEQQGRHEALPAGAHS